MPTSAFFGPTICSVDRADVEPKHPAGSTGADTRRARYRRGLEDWPEIVAIIERRDRYRLALERARNHLIDKSERDGRATSLWMHGLASDLDEVLRGEG